ncbi:hypothetical protein IFM89_027982 [Coptis chinensis]|uniref:Ferric oxidoreductase domain-containing protein n=1 Tax=Coptis chinensis TaxID=261450 RepID=A0A835H171_9MAGN|nr:hypothetical protein IFM89_027982 [Coptis chinensis]
MPLTEFLFQTYWRRAWIIICWLFVCFSLFTWKFTQYRNRKAFEVMGYCLCIAKGSAETLKFNMALILLPVYRNTIMWLRKNRSLNSSISFNDNINFHKLIASCIVIGVILHGGTHIAYAFPRIVGCSHSIFRTTIGADFQNHQPSYIEILSTIEAATGITMVLLMGMLLVYLGLVMDDVHKGTIMGR